MTAPTREANANAASRLLAWLRVVLPKGDQLSEEAWRVRHRAILALLVGQAFVIFGVGVARGYGFEHSLFEGSIVGIAAMLASTKLGNRTVRSTVASFGLISSSAIFTHLSGGYIEVHFHFFVMLAVISMYQQWPPFLLSILYVVVHHGLFGVIDPHSVYNHPDAIAHPWKWAAIHGAFVSAACAAYVVAWRLSEAAQARAQDILNSVGEGIVGLKANGDVAFVNHAAETLTMFREDEIVGEPLDRWLISISGSTHDADAGPGTLLLAAADGHDAIEGVVRRKDGTTVPVELSRTAMGEGTSGDAVIAFRDVTERKHAEDARQQYTAELARLNDELARSNAELEQFAYVASHDLQEPLRKVQAFGDRLIATSGAALGADGTDYLERMQGAARRMQILISDLLSFSRVSTRSEPSTLVDLQVVAQEVLSDLEVRIQELHAEVLVGQLPAVEANRTQMRQLFQNLIGNALKFHRPDERPIVEVSAHYIHGADATLQSWQITVEDNGIGFEQQYADRIFGVFQRLHGRGEYEGTGIGLAVCKKIAELHGGSIRATSMPGGGARFVVTLPARVGDIEAAA